MTEKASIIKYGDGQIMPSWASLECSCGDTYKEQLKGVFGESFSAILFSFPSGGKTYDKDHVVILPENDERPSQQWEIELL